MTTPLKSKLPLGIVFIAFFISGCLSTTAGPKKAYSVGPNYTSENQESRNKSKTDRQTELSILILPLDPNIPEDPDEFTKKNI